MSCNSAIYMANTSEQELLAGAQIPFGSIVRRFGRFCNMNGSDLVIGDCVSRDGNGYYDVDCTITISPSAIGAISAQLYVNGEPYPGATASEYSATANNPVNISFPATVRLYGCCNLATLQVRLGEENGGTILNMATRVRKD